MFNLFRSRDKAVRILLGGLLLVVAVSMLTYLVPNYDTGNGASAATVVATVGSDPITVDDVQKLVQSSMRGKQLPPDMLPIYLPQLVDSMIIERAMAYEADRLGFQVSDADVRTAIQQNFPNLFPDGRFVGKDSYAAMLAQQGMTIAEFENDLRRQVMVTRLRDVAIEGSIVTPAEIEHDFRQKHEKIKIQYVKLTNDQFKKEVAPNDADIQAYYAAHQAQYKTEEQVKTRHILINSPDGADAKTDAAAKAKAEDVLKQVKAGGNFAELAKKYSEDPGSKDTGGELPMIPTSQLDPAYATAAMALKPGETSGLVKSKFGYHIIQTEDKKAAGVQPLSEVKDSIAQLLEQQKQGAAVQAFGQQLVAEATKNGLDKMAAAHGLRAETTDYVARGGMVGGLSDSSGLLTQAFAAAKGAAPAVVSTGDGFAVFQVVDVKPAHAPAFADWKTHVLEDFRDQNVPQVLTTQLNKLDDRAKQLGDLKKAADEMHIPLKTSDLVGEDGQVPDLGPMSGPGSVAFTLAVGAISGPINTGRDGIVLTVTDKQQPSAEDIAKNFAQVKDQLLNEQRNEIFRVYVGTLADKYEKGGAIRYAKAPPKSALPGL